MEANPNPERRWQNMRRMAWISLICGLVYPVGVYLTNGERLIDIASYFYLFVGAVVGSYMGFSTWGDKK